MTEIYDMMVYTLIYHSYFKFETSTAPIIIDPTAIPCATTLSLMRYLDVLIGPRNLYA